MISRTRYGLMVLLVLAAGWSMGAPQAGAQPVPSDDAQASETGVADDADDAGIKDAEAEEVDITGLELDWSQLNVDASTLTANPASKASMSKASISKARTPAVAGSDTSWSSRDKPNGSALSVKQSISPLWDARVGADMTVVNQPQTATSADLLRQKYLSDQPSQSSGTAWAAITAPGVGPIWDKTAIEARVDPAQEQSKFGTSLSKSLPLGEQYSLTLQNGYNVIQQGIVPVPGIPGHPMRNYGTEQTAKLSIAETNTSLLAGQSLSSADDKWLRKVGAEQKLFGGVSITGTIGETPFGPSNKSLTAGFKHSW